MITEALNDPVIQYVAWADSSPRIFDESLMWNKNHYIV